MPATIVATTAMTAPTRPTDNQRGGGAASALVHPKPPRQAAARRRLRARKPDARNVRLEKLQIGVYKLQQEVEGLKNMRAMLMNRAMNRPDSAAGSFMRTVREYFHFFQSGYVPDFKADGVSPVQTSSFLRAIMDENVAAGAFSGVENLIEQGELYSAAFRDKQLKLLDLQVIPDDVLGERDSRTLVTGWGQYSCYVTLKTIEIIFPHVMGNHALVTRMLGQHIIGVGRYDFVFDSELNRVVVAQVDMDFFPVFMNILKDPTDMALLFGEALISTEYFIGDVDKVQPHEPCADELTATQMRLERILCEPAMDSDSDSDNRGDSESESDAESDGKARKSDRGHARFVELP